MPLIDVNGTKLFYDLTGPEDAPVVALSNSLGSALEMWDEQARALAGRYRVLRYDTRGHGRSEVRDQPITIEDLADDLVGLLDALDIPDAHIVGLSLGGMTAQVIGVRHPTRARSLVMMATSPHMPPRELWDGRIGTVMKGGMGALVDGIMTRWFTEETRTTQPDKVARIRQQFLRTDPTGYAVCCQAIRDMDLRPIIGAIALPTLIIAGAEDPSTPPSHSEEIRSRIPNAEMVVIPRAAHMLAPERPEIVNAHLLAFLARFDAPRQPAGGVPLEAGLANRKSVLGHEHVERSFARAGTFAQPWQEFISRYAWGEIWGDPALPWKTRSMVVLTITAALHREEEFKLHLRPALGNGVTIDELRALLKQVAVYAGVPAANAAFRWSREVLGEEADSG